MKQNPETMKIFSKVIFYAFLGFVFASCSRSSTPTKNTTNTIGDYDEDLSAVRVRYESKPVVEKNDSKVVKEKPATTPITKIPKQVNSQVDIALDSMAVRNKSVRYSSGYRIQVFVGNDRKEVDEAKAFIYQNYPELNTYLTYSQPTYKLKAGDFTSRLDAERYFSFVKQRYSAAMIVSERIDIRKSMQAK